MNKTALNVNDRLFDAVSVILEEMCFMVPEEGAADVVRTEKPEAVSIVSFQGPVSGEMVVCTYGTLLPLIGSNIVGEHTTGTELQEDAFREFTNILCGNFLPALSEVGSLYSIRQPEILRPEECCGEHPEPDIKANILLDSGEMDIMLFLS